MGQDEMVLGHGYLVAHAGGLIYLVVEAHLLDDTLHQRTGVALVIDGEIGVKAYRFGLCPEDSGKHAVKGAHLQISGKFFSHQTADALLHLTGSLIGKRQCEDIPGSDRLVLLQQPRNLIRQHPCLA